MSILHHLLGSDGYTYHNIIFIYNLLYFLRVGHTGGFGGGGGVVVGGQWGLYDQINAVMFA